MSTTIETTKRSTIGTDEIRALRSEAGAAGDREQVAMCDRALAGDAASIRGCEDAILAARAMAD